VLAIAAAAVLAGSRSVQAIGEWAAEAPQVVLAALRARQHPLTGRFRAPHIDTFRRVLRRVDAEAVDRAIGVFLAERAGIGTAECPQGDTDPSAPDGQPGTQRRPAQDTPATRGLSVDGKAVRGAIQPDGRAVHLLAAMTHERSAVLAQRDVAHKTNEITQVKPLLDPLELTGWAITLDALHA